MVVKVRDEFVWHKHDETDDFFLVLKGRLEIQLRDGVVELGPGETLRRPAWRRASASCARGNAPVADRTLGHAQHGRRRHCGAASRPLRR